MKLTAVAPQLLVLPDTPPAKINGILIPDKARKPVNSGVIVSSFDGAELKEGEHVCFNHRQGYEVENLLSINEAYIVGIKTDNYMQPLHDRILVQPIKKDQSLSRGGVVLLEDPNISEGLVLKVGTGKKDEPMMLTEGDKIIYPKHAGIRIGDELVLTQSEVIAITNEEEVGNDFDD
jgi:chaperonin GroES